MFLFLFQQPPIDFVKVALRQGQRLAERLDLGRSIALEHYGLVTPHFVAQPLDFSPELDDLDSDFETDALYGRLGLGLNRRDALRRGSSLGCGFTASRRQLCEDLIADALHALQR